MSKSKFEIGADFLRTPWVWGTLAVGLALGLGWISMDELERLADILGKFFSTVFDRF